MTQTIHAIKGGAAVVLAITLSACATQVGRDFDAAYAMGIRPGQTTKAEIRSKLGRPLVVSRAGEEDTWTYAHYRGGGIAHQINEWFGRGSLSNPTGAQQKRLVVTFKGDSVKDAKFTQELPLPDPLEEAYR